MDILEFKGEHRFLSNFWPCVVKLNGMIFPSVEHAYQAAKTTDTNQQLEIQRASKAGDAKRLGKRVRLREDWESIKLDTMLNLVRQKFEEPRLAELLEATGDSKIVEGNWWNDRFWGVCGGTGLNHLGKILMQVRSEKRARKLGVSR